MKCSRCGGEIPDNSGYCNLCGAKQKGDKEKLKKERTQLKTFTQCLKESNDDYSDTRNYNTKIKNYSTKKLRTTIGIIAAFVAICGITLLVIETKPIRDYNEAVRYMDNGDYDLAIATFQVLGDYKDAREMTIAAQNKKLEVTMETAYTNGIKLYESDNYEEALKTFLELGDYRESIQLIEEIKAAIYKAGMDSINTQDYKTAAEYFAMIPDYLDVNEYIKQISPYITLEGTWQQYVIDKFIDSYLVICGLNAYSKNYFSMYRNEYSNVDIDPRCVNISLDQNDNRLNIISDGIFGDDETEKAWLEDDILYREYDFKVAGEKYTCTQIFKKISDSTNASFLVIKAPRIGMDKIEVGTSTWGSPIDINYTTTAYGTSEQWVYEGYRYIYFDDGIVTGIQN